MFPLSTARRQPPRGLAPAGVTAVPGQRSPAGLILRLGPLVALLSAALPLGVSAQALGTMQVTARVVPAEASWGGLTTAQALALEVLSHPTSRAVRREDVARVEAAVASGDGPRRVLLTIDYPRN